MPRRVGWHPNLGEKVNRRTRNMDKLCKREGEADCWGAIRFVESVSRAGASYVLV